MIDYDSQDLRAFNILKKKKGLTENVGLAAAMQVAARSIDPVSAGVGIERLPGRPVLTRLASKDEGLRFGIGVESAADFVSNYARIKSERLELNGVGVSGLVLPRTSKSP